MTQRILNIYRVGGALGVWRAILWHLNLAGARKLSRKLLDGRSGIEIGGPSAVFSAKGPLPVYPVVGTLDNCNFATTTLWQGQVDAGKGTYRFDAGGIAGNQYIGEATDMQVIPSSKYDFLICSHVIEHVANPLQALIEWLRILKPGGIILLVAPHHVGAFDHLRPVTQFKHLLDDFEKKTKEDDLTHLPEILALHDLTRDPDAGTHAEFEKRSQKNFENRCLHHHVFDVTLVSKMLTHVGCEVLTLDQLPPHHIIALAQKPY